MQVQYCLSLFGGTGSYLWGMNQIHFQETGLKVAFCRAVIFQGIQQKGCALLQKTVLHEHIHNLLRLDKLQKRGLYTHMYIFLCIQKAWGDVMILHPLLSALCKDPNLSQTERTGYHSTYHAAFPCFHSITIMVIERQVSHFLFL